MRTVLATTMIILWATNISGQHMDWPFLINEKNIQKSIEVNSIVESVEGILYITPEIAWEREKSKKYTPISEDIQRQICENIKRAGLSNCDDYGYSFQNYLTINYTNEIDIVFAVTDSHYGSKDKVFLNVVKKNLNKVLNTEVICDWYGDVGSYRKIKSAIVQWNGQWYVRRYWKNWTDDSLDDGLQHFGYKIWKDNLTIFTIDKEGLLESQSKDGL